jgi:hypothetical protein
MKDLLLRVRLLKGNLPFLEMTPYQNLTKNPLRSNSPLDEAIRLAVRRLLDNPLFVCLTEISLLNVFDQPKKSLREIDVAVEATVDVFSAWGRPEPSCGLTLPWAEIV